jgi:hypothetical protein
MRLAAAVAAAVAAAGRHDIFICGARLSGSVTFTHTTHTSKRYFMHRREHRIDRTSTRRPSSALCGVYTLFASTSTDLAPGEAADELATASSEEVIFFSATERWPAFLPAEPGGMTGRPGVAP